MVLYNVFIKWHEKRVACLELTADYGEENETLDQ